MSPIGGAALFSFFINLAMLASPLYMMQVYDRVLQSRSNATLIMLTVVTVGILLAMAVLEWARSMVMIRMGTRIDKTLRGRLFDAIFERQLRQARASRTQPLTDLLTVRQFLGGPGMYALFDVPWAPLMMIVLYFMHPLMFAITAVGGVILLILAISNEVLTRRRLALASGDSAAGLQFAETSLRNAEVIEAMGMIAGVRRRWLEWADRVLFMQSQASGSSAAVTSSIKFVRIVLQTALLGAGAYLTVQGQMTAGMMIAASIIGSKALAPIEQAVGAWGAFIAARLSYRRLDELLRAVPPRDVPMELPPPQGRLTLEAVTAVPPGASVPTIRGVSLEINPGEVVGIVGPSAAGKTTLMRLMAGVWPAHMGKVRLDGADVRMLDRVRVGPYVGYLPQDIELFDGTVAENIARFGHVDASAVTTAAMMAGVHDMILRLPKGYDTPLGDGGSQVSGGQKQRIALARALYGDPVLFLFDEPNSNLDEEGEAALIAAIRQLKAAERTVVLIAHRAVLLNHVDKIMVMRDGQVTAFGPRLEIMQKMMRPNIAPAPMQAPAAAFAEQRAEG